VYIPPYLPELHEPDDPRKYSNKKNEVNHHHHHYYYYLLRYRPLGRPRHRWEDGIRMDLREIGWEGVDWIQLAQDTDQWWALVNMVMNLRVVVPQS
jgi:hypothetical protein